MYGPAARCKRKVMIWKVGLRICIRPIVGAFELLAIMDIRARSSHSRLGPEGQKGHLITNALAKPLSISSFGLADRWESQLDSHSLGELERFRLPPS